MQIETGDSRLLTSADSTLSWPVGRGRAGAVRPTPGHSSGRSVLLQPLCRLLARKKSGRAFLSESVPWFGQKVKSLLGWMLSPWWEAPLTSAA